MPGRIRALYVIGVNRCVNSLTSSERLRRVLGGPPANSRVPAGMEVAL